MFRLNPDRFKNFPAMKRAKEIEKLIDISMRKFYRSNVDKTKAQALVEEAEGYYARNREYHSDIYEFHEYIKHWTLAHRGIISDVYLDMIEAQFGRLDGPLYVILGHSSWNTSRDWRNDNE